MFSGTYILLVTSFLLLITTSNGTLDSPIQSVYESMTPPMTPWAQDPPLQSVYESMTPPMTADQWHIHDPSRIVEVDGHLMIGVTGKAQENGYRCGLETWYISPGSLDWSPGQCLLMDKPDWIKQELPDNDGAFWAPAMLNSTAMYYSVFAPEDSTCVGMLTSSGLAPNLSWTDIGAPVTCTFNAESDDENSPPTSIDPSTLVDADGKHYLVYGGGHIWITGLNPDTGLQIENSWWAPGDSSYERLANGPWNEEDEMDDWVEAAFMYKHEDYYYLFVNWYGCCDGVDSTYQIHMGRSSSPYGPFTDREGNHMRDGFGDVFLAGEGRFIGPGHASVFSALEKEWFSFHFYDGERDGLPWVETRQLVWEAEGHLGIWPRVTGNTFNPADYWARIFPCFKLI